LSAREKSRARCKEDIAKSVKFYLLALGIKYMDDRVNRTAHTANRLICPELIGSAAQCPSRQKPILIAVAKSGQRSFDSRTDVWSIDPQPTHLHLSVASAPAGRTTQAGVFSWNGQNQHEIAAAYLNPLIGICGSLPFSRSLTRAKRWFAGDGEARCFAPGRRLPVLGENARWAGDAVRFCRYLPT
jgi:hypothetical protein